MDTSIICFGAAHLDLKASAKTSITWGEKIPVTTSMSFGGVARNVAENLCRLGKSVALISRIGYDQAGELVRANLDQLGIDGRMISTSTVKQTASFTALIAQNGDMAIALSDMEIYDEMHIVDEELQQLERARIWLVDANLPDAMLRQIAGSCPPWISLWAAGTSVAKNPRFLTIVNDIDVLVVNHQEAATFFHAPPRIMVVTKGCYGAELVEQGGDGCVSMHQ